MLWRALVGIQIGGYDDPALTEDEMAAFLAAFADAARSAPGAGAAEVREPDDCIPRANPTRRVTIALRAPDEEEAERAARDIATGVALRAALGALPEERRGIGWVIGVEIGPA